MRRIGLWLTPGERDAFAALQTRSAALAGRRADFLAPSMGGS